MTRQPQLGRSDRRAERKRESQGVSLREEASDPLLLSSLPYSSQLGSLKAKILLLGPKPESLLVTRPKMEVV